jgi:hypothetical protein
MITATCFRKGKSIRRTLTLLICALFLFFLHTELTQTKTTEINIDDYSVPTLKINEFIKYSDKSEEITASEPKPGTHDQFKVVSQDDRVTKPDVNAY